MARGHVGRQIPGPAAQADRFSPCTPLSARFGVRPDSHQSPKKVILPLSVLGAPAGWCYYASGSG